MGTATQLRYKQASFGLRIPRLNAQPFYFWMIDGRSAVELFSIWIPSIRLVMVAPVSSGFSHSRRQSSREHQPGLSNFAIVSLNFFNDTTNPITQPSDERVIGG